MSIGHDPEHAPSSAASKQAMICVLLSPTGITIWFPNEGQGWCGRVVDDRHAGAEPDGIGLGRTSGQGGQAEAQHGCSSCPDCVPSTSLKAYQLVPTTTGSLMSL